MNEAPRTVQQYIDQAPAWPDGTPTVFVPILPTTRRGMGAWITSLFRIETTGTSLETLDR